MLRRNSRRRRSKSRSRSLSLSSSAVEDVEVDQIIDVWRYLKWQTFPPVLRTKMYLKV